MKPPAGVSEAVLGPIVVWACPEVAPWARDAIGEAGSMHAHASRSAGVVTLQGRGPVHVFTAPVPSASDVPAHWVVRRFYRGGGMRWLGDRHLHSARPRPFAEWGASELLRSRGIATPRVRAAAVHRSGLVYRGEVVTDYIPDGIELAALLFGDGAGEREPAVVESALQAAGALALQFADAGVYHPDLNARNILLRPHDTGWTAVVLDLDRCRIGEASLDPSPMRARLARSIEKLGHASGRPLPSPALKALEASGRRS